MAIKNINTDVNIIGNLTVEGTTTSINTTTVEVKDNILQLNTTPGSPDTATATTSGISIYRGDAVTQASLIFDDADDTWDLTNNLVVGGVITATGGTITGNLNVVTSNVGTTTLYSLASIEGDDAHLDLISSADGSWGSAINFVEGTNSTTNANVWSIARQTTGADGSLNFNYGTLNNHNVAGIKIKFSNDGVITAADGNSTQWNAGYNYSNIGHLPLSGGTISGNVGLGVALADNYRLNIQFDNTNPDNDIYFAQRIDGNFSGLDNTTGDREQGGIWIDIDSSANGDADNEHRLYGIYSDVRFTGFSDLVYGTYNYVESNYNTGNTAIIVASYNYAAHDTTSTGGVTGLYGSLNAAVIDDAGSVGTAYAANNIAIITTTRTTDVNTTYGSWNEVQIDSPNVINYGNLIAVQAVLDNNQGAVPTGTNSFLFKGDYQGTRYATNSYGLFIAGDKHYLEGKLGVGVSDPSVALDVDGVINATGGNSTNWNLAYDYRVVGHLPLAGGTLTGDLTIQSATPSIILRDTDTSNPSNQGIRIYNEGVDANLPDGEGLMLVIDTTDTEGTDLTPSLQVAGNVYASGGKSTEWNTAYGWGDHSIAGYFKKRDDIPTGADLNTYTTDGYYHQNSNANAVAGSNYPAGIAGMLSVLSDGVMVYQTYQGYGSNGTWERKYYNGTWESWKKNFDDTAGTLTGDLIINKTGGGVIRLQNNDTTNTQFQALGRLEWYNQDASGFGPQSAAIIEAAAAGTAGQHADLLFKTTVAVEGADATTTMRIGSDGFVGIGTTNPSRMLEVNGDAFVAGEFLATTAGLVRINQYDNGLTGAGEIALWADGGTGWNTGDGLGRIRFYTADGSGIGARDLAKIEAVSENGDGATTTTMSGALAFYTSPYNENVAERMRITAGGTLLHGDTAVPGETVWKGTAVFGVNGTDKVITGHLISTTNGAIIGGHNSALTAWAPLAIAGTELRFNYEQARVMTMTSTGLGIGTTSPGYKLEIATDNTGAGMRIVQDGNSGYAPASIILEARQAASRGSGLYHYNTQSDISWYSGTLYNNTGKWGIAVKTAETTWNPDVAQTTYTKFLVDSSGNVGIGTTSPSEKLHVVGAGGTQVLIQNTTTTSYANMGFIGTARSYYVGVGNGAETALNLANKFYVYDGQANAVRLVVDTDGNVGIGTTSPSEKLHVAGNLQLNQFIYKFLGSVADTFNGYVLIAYVQSGVNANASSFRGEIHIERGSSGAFNIHESVYVSAKRAYNNFILEKLDGGKRIVTLTYNSVAYYAVELGATSSRAIYVSGFFEGFTPILAQASQVSSVVEWRTASRLGLFGTSASLVVNGSTRFHVDSSGNVGIGTTAPRYQLDLAIPQNSTQVDYIALGVNNGPSGGGGTALGSGIIWKANYSGYTKRSAGIVQIAESNYFQSGLAFYTNGTADASTDWVEAMRISKDQNVGIGTTVPSSKLDIEDAVDRVMNTSGTGQFEIQGNGYTFGIAMGAATTALYHNSSSRNLSFGTNETERLTITGGGNVGIGTTLPAQKLHVSGGSLRIDNSVGSRAYITLNENSTDENIVLEYDGTLTGTGNYFAMYSNVTGWIGKGGGFNYIPSNGFVGIGTTSPSGVLHVADTPSQVTLMLGRASGVATIKSDGTSDGHMIIDSGSGGTAVWLQNYTTGNVYLATGGGNVGIGTTTTNAKLTVAGDILPSGDNTGVIGNTDYTWADGQFTNLSVNSTLTVVSTLNVRSAIDLADSDILRFGSSDDFKMYYDGTANEMEFEMEATCTQIRVHDNGTTRFTLDRAAGTFTATGDVIAYSDVRVKENVETIDNALDKVMLMRGVSYNRTDSDDKTKKVGVIAQEIQKVLPEVVQENSDGMLGVSYGNIVGVLIEAIKEQQKQIDELKAMINGGTK